MRGKRAHPRLRPERPTAAPRQRARTRRSPRARRPGPPYAGCRSATRGAERRPQRARRSGPRRRAGGTARTHGRQSRKARSSPSSSPSTIPSSTARRSPETPDASAEAMADRSHPRPPPRPPRRPTTSGSRPRRTTWTPWRRSQVRSSKPSSLDRGLATRTESSRIEPWGGDRPTGSWSRTGSRTSSVREALDAPRNAERELRTTSGSGHGDTGYAGAPDLGRHRATVDRLQPQRAPPRSPRGSSRRRAARTEPVEAPPRRTTEA